VTGGYALTPCTHCASVYLDPRPAGAALDELYPDDYYAYAAPPPIALYGRDDALARAWYALRRGVLLRRYGYTALSGSTLLAETAGRLPRVRRLATYLYDVELHPWVAGGRLLEVGCGAGRYLQLMRALGWSVVGVDTSPEAIRVARDVVGLEAHVGDVRDLGLDDASFDAVTLAHTLEHVPEPVEALRELRRVTRPGGRLAIVVPNVKSLGATRFGADWIGWDYPRHLTNFSAAGLGAVLERAGWKPQSICSTSRAAHLFMRASAAVRAGAERQQAIGTNARPPLRARTRINALTQAERLLCAARRPVGEELLAVAYA
jgi:SAM-dependent methyltransferase